MAVFHLIYRSTATCELSETEMNEMLQKARNFNAAHRLTGILLRGDGQYMQVLEGEKQHVENLYASIRQDKRHRQVLTITEGEILQPVFPAWSMGFLEATPAEFKRLVSHVEPKTMLHLASRSVTPGHGLLALLQEFAMAKIVQF